jgi:hypothetical protein
MTDYEIGYGKPPRHSQFKKVSAPTQAADPGVATLNLGTSCAVFERRGAVSREGADQKYVKIGIDDQATCHFSVEP